MKKILVVLTLFIIFSSQADQLAYLSETNAIEEVKKIFKMSNLYLFCACCSVIEPKKVEVLEVSYTHTGYEDYYEVSVTSKTEDGTTKTSPVNLPYVWKKALFGYKTIGQILGLEHDKYVEINEWNDPKHIEKDI